MLRNSVSVDMKIYAQQLKQKFTAGFFHEILQNFRTATLENNLGGCLWKENRGDKGRGVTLVVSGDLYFFQSSCLVMKQSSFSTNFRITEPFNLDYLVNFYKRKNGLICPVFTIKVLVAETFGCYYSNNWSTAWRFCTCKWVRYTATKQ